jgi:type I restriction enzyme, R subunit
MFDAPVKQYILFADFEQDVKERKVADVPNQFTDNNGILNKHAQAYFGLFKHIFDKSLLDSCELNDEKLIKYAFEIDTVVKTAVAEYSINPGEIENAISVKLLPMLFADLGIESAERFIQEVLKNTRHGLSRS